MDTRNGTQNEITGSTADICNKSVWVEGVIPEGGQPTDTLYRYVTYDSATGTTRYFPTNPATRIEVGTQLELDPRTCNSDNPIVYYTRFPESSYMNGQIYRRYLTSGIVERVNIQNAYEQPDPGVGGVNAIRTMFYNAPGLDELVNLDSDSSRGFKGILFSQSDRRDVQIRVDRSFDGVNTMKLYENLSIDTYNTQSKQWETRTLSREIDPNNSIQHVDVSPDGTRFLVLQGSSQSNNVLYEVRQTATGLILATVPLPNGYRVWEGAEFANSNEVLLRTVSDTVINPRVRRLDFATGAVEDMSTHASSGFLFDIVM